MKSGYAEVFIVPKVQALPIALVAQSSSLLAENTDTLCKIIEEFILGNPMLEAGQPSSNEGIEDPLARVASKGETLAEHLYTQLRMNEKDPAMLYTGWYIINSLDRDGYLREDERELIRAAGSNAQIYQKALRAVQSLEPAGIAARNLSECLCIQLRRQAEPDSLALKIAAHYLEKLAEHKLKIEGYSKEQLEEATQLIRSLNPRPGLQYDEAPIVYVSPDVRIEFDGDGKMEITLINQPVNPVLSEQYSAYLKIEAEMDKQYIKDSLCHARSFLYALEQRGRTLLHIAAYTAERQKEYLQTRNQHTLHQLTFSNVADALGISVSLVSRAVRNKYVQCDGRIFPMKMLFTTGGCSNTSREAIIERIQRICQKSQHNMTDRSIAEALSSEGILISRRTVNKYRNLYLAGEKNGI